MEWRHGNTPLLNFQIKNSAGNFLASIFWGTRWYRVLCLSSKRPNHQRGVLLISAGAIEAHIERKKPRKTQQVCRVYTQQCPSTQGTCNKEETGLSELPLS
jgi:hypothetical protein